MGAKLTPACPCVLDLVVAAYESETCMVTDPLDVVERLFCDIFCECIRKIIDVACEHQILPDDQAVLVAKIIERIGRVISAAPYSYGVEVTLDGRF